MPLRFTKLQGLCNDYVYISLFDQRVSNPPELARAISDRHRGVGSDGLILVAPPDVPTADVRMIVYNADGSRAQMCGNGIRCLAKLVYERGWAKANPMTIQTDCGLRLVQLTLDDTGRVTDSRVDMGEPILDPRKIPVAVDAERVVRHPISVEGETLLMTCVSVGNPHAVFFERANIHFVQVLRRDLAGMITWERGSGITKACGSGAAAVCVAGVLNDLTNRQLTIRLPGGQLMLNWDSDTEHVFMSGPAEEVFTGEWPT
jgi:diaminopimelate epimerase